MFLLPSSLYFDIFLGSEDTSVRFWRIGKAHHQRKLYPICTFFGHTRGVTCIDLCVEFSLCASGSKDKNVMVWDCRTHRLIRVLRYHNGPVISVSINSLTGWIATLTELQVRLYHINGDLLSYFNMANLRISLPTVVYATPCSDWQDGVVMITGHRNGHLLLWKMCHYDGVLAANSIDAADVSSKVLQNAVSDEHTSALSLLSPEEGNSSRKISSAESNSPLFNNNTNISIKRQLYVAYTPTRTHKANITVIKLCAVAPSALTRGKEIITRSSDHVRSLDLFVGDAAGYISRWTPLKLDQLPPNELVSILKSDK